MINKVFENYDIFYNMVLSTTIMSNSNTPEFVEDATKVIHFIGSAYKLDSALVDTYQQFILCDLTSLSLVTEQQMIYINRKLGDEYRSTDALFDIKGDVLAMLNDLSENSIQHHLFNTNKSWFDYTHYKSYQAQVRYSKINKASAYGNITATRQAGIHKALGIGCEQNINEALLRFTQCVFWGDIPSMHYLAYAHTIAGNTTEATEAYQLAELASKYLLSGITVLPEDAKTQYSVNACNNYNCISSIKQDIIAAHNVPNINFSFVEAITSPSVDYSTRMSYINNYNKNGWKNLTNPATSTTSKLGF